jgi:serine/threonine protein kinase
MIGSGVSGEIFKTLLVKSGRTIAIKRLEKNLTESEENEEVKILSRLRHENIIEFYGSESNSQHVLIFMEYVTEKSLGHLVAEYGPLEETTIKIYLRQILEAFAYIHKQSIIHRDIKASNILVSAVGQIKVTDFGCATIISPTQEKYFNGSVLWSAPEVLQSGQYTISSDVWSLGCLIIELLTGQTPWTERNFDNEMSAIYEIGSNRILPEIPQGVSRPLHDIINRCLQFDPEKRASC